MKQSIQDLINSAIKAVAQQLDTSLTPPSAIQVDSTRDKQHGDFASNIAMVLAKQAGMPPRQLAELIIEHCEGASEIEKIEIAGPGFINFFVKQESQVEIIKQILTAGDNFGQTDKFKGQRVLIEFVSANPTGPLHVGHGRGAAYGAVLANLLSCIGYQVDCEYYVNDAGRQMDILAASVYLRYLDKNGIQHAFPENAYQGDYIFDIAEQLQKSAGDSLIRSIEPEPADEAEQALDNLIDAIKTKLGERYEKLHSIGLNAILDDIKQDLTEFGVTFQNWFSEMSLSDDDSIQQALDKLDAEGHLYEKEGAIWFRSAALGDEKDRVVVRDNGQKTYFASDIAYHHNKYQRGYDRIIDIWGADHHGYIARVRAALEALGNDNKKLEVLLVQFVSLYRGREKLAMSTRSGQFVTLSDLREEVGRDATRFFYVMRKSEQHLDFDLELAKSSKKENPVYYIQYAHARICRLLEKLGSDNSLDTAFGLKHLDKLDSDKEQLLMKKLALFSDTVEKAGLNYEPHLLIYYLKELANEFHTYYDTHRIMDVEAELKSARIILCIAVQQVIRNSLKLLGVSAPESM